MTDRQVPFADLNVRESALGSEILGAMTRVLGRGWFILGPEVEAFEREFASFVGTARAVGVACGTDALSLSLVALGVGPGDEVITSPLTATFTALAISRIGAKPVFADVDPDTLNLSPESVRKQLGPRSKAILPVHLYGNPCDLPAFQKLADSEGLRLVEDACQAHGAKLDGRSMGSWGDAGCFSFYPTKNLGALGDGGMIVTNDESLAEHLQRLRNGGQVSRYLHDEVGFNSRLDELQAAVLRVKLPKLSAWNRRRRELVAHYIQLLEKTPVKTIRLLPGSESAAHLFVVRVSDRAGLGEALVSQGIQTLIHYPIPAHLQPAYRALGQEEGSCPVAEQASREILSLPLFPGLAESQVERVAQVIRSYYR
jgi:dTDP-4-amino-4,6-dideoxygalactose transaminase